MMEVFCLVLYTREYIEGGMRRVLVLLLAFGIFGPHRSLASELSVAAASDLVFCLEELNLAFGKAHPEIRIKSATGASGNIFAQISNGAPFDVFLSADMRYPLELIKAGLAEKESLTRYASGHLVVWTSKEEIDISAGISSLTSGAVRKVAIANPEHAPYGRAAKAALVYFDLWLRLQEKLVFGENIAQTAQFVETGNADAGIVALSIVLAPNLSSKGRWIEVPEHTYPRLEQGAIMTKVGALNPASAAYIEFLGSAEARRIFDRFGFRLPP
jgi:molybdate transport system substrate-binding protein